MEQTYVLVTGGFDPLHSGHIAYFKAAKKLGDRLIVGLNSDEWLERKKGKAFMSWNERLCIVNNLQMVDEVFTFMDDDDSATNFIRQVKAHYPTDKLIFANGGDRTSDNIPEMVVDGVEFEFGVGGEDKKNSSSWILEDWKAPKTIRPWGFYRVLDTGPGWAVKELTIMPGKTLSDQRHTHRSEHWHVVQGEVTITTEFKKRVSTAVIGPQMSYDIGKLVWHKPHNNTNEPVKIIETWFGDILEESDIERRTR
jgi:cytidyltransferase-like protein